jgi:GntR family transcriptional regulator/MocR family aminotransferase
MSANRAGQAPQPARIVLGFGNVGERAIGEGIAAIGDLLARRAG